MKTLFFTTLLAFCIGHHFLWAQAYSLENLEVNYRPDKQQENHFTYQKLRLYPILAKTEFLAQQVPIGHYTSLKDALLAKSIVISESENRQLHQPDFLNINEVELEEEEIQTNDSVRRGRRQRTNNLQQNRNNQAIQRTVNNQSSSAQVNQLLIENLSGDTVYVMAGEIVQGGKQDRVIAQDMLIPPRSGQLPLPVFCVEKGRWTYGDNANFEQYYGFSSVKLRSKVSVDRDQGAVWGEVARANANNKVSTATGAYTAQLSSKNVQEQMEAYTQFFKDKLAEMPNVIGVIVVSGDKVVGCDMFASPVLFKNQFDELLTSYAYEAITDGQEVNIQPDAVETYVQNLLADEAKQEKFLQNKGNVFKDGNRKLRISSY
ncbi:MAG TPA: hypothetical protein DCM08_03655 [Microscillaceae bacterium]|jgi:hypothetical protein|nr:hypothetical protein [Microscillaceae bacterium]